MSSANAVTNPTWYGNIQEMFRQNDIACMQGQFGPAFNLGSYQFVATHSNQIGQVVSSGYMPEGGPPWTHDMVTTFRNWVAAGYPEGTPVGAPGGAEALAAVAPPSRIRKDIRSLTSEEIKKLGDAFQGIISLPITNPNSYFALAAIHWLPAPDFYCMHHEPGFLPWHRAYQILFESALRSIPGCEDVTIPYWDITMETPLPTWLFNPPFASYTIPQDIGADPGSLNGNMTLRNSASVILEQLGGDGKSPFKNVFSDVANAMRQVTWEGFNGFFANADFDTLIAGHDYGHNSIGPTMGDQGVAAFDPIFWMFHNNWDRLFWEWQKHNNATTQAGMLSRIARDDASYATFTDPVAGQLSPFTVINPRFIAKDLLNLNEWDIDYAPPVATPALMAAAAGFKTLHAAESFGVDLTMVHVRVDGVNRLRIPGSFEISLMNDGKIIGTANFFQPSNVQQCKNCIKHAMAHFDFKLPASAIAGGKLNLSVRLTNRQAGQNIDIASLGNPTIEVLIPLHKAQ
jgi:tyrosinase